MYVGVDYYPEHWPRSRWETDARLMQQAGFNVVRLAEFAWVQLEPQEAVFDFAWLDDALTVLHKHGISAILGTPTGAMPAWCAHKYPQTLALKAEGNRTVWGGRKNNCFSDTTFRRLSQGITTAMAEHYADTPNVIGWQSDNEYGFAFCYCDTCRAEFQEYLRRKFGTLARFNEAMGTHFWSHRIGDWAEIPIPTSDAFHSPHLLLEHRRFHSWLHVRFQHEQVEILRRTCPKHFVTHNLMGLTAIDVDYWDLAKDLDHVSWDNYPLFEDGPPTSPAAGADLMRSVKRRNFWIMEQSAGPHGAGNFGRNLKPGELRQISYQQLAHGCDGQIWFRWRTCTAGREQYWHGLLGHDGRALRRYEEAAKVAREYHALADELAGTTVKPEVAFVFDYDSIWAFNFQGAYQLQKDTDSRWLNNHYLEAIRRYYEALYRAGVNVDFVRPGDDLSGYKVVFAPHLYVLPDSVANSLAQFVERGGVLVTDSRTGVKDETGLCHERTLPGLLSQCLGIEIEEYESLRPGLEYVIRGAGEMAGDFTAVMFADWITPRGASVLASYTPWHVEAFAAATVHNFGKGRGYYVGTIFKEPAFYDRLIAQVLASADIQPAVKPPVGVEVSYRQGQGKELLFLVNTTEQHKTVSVPPGKTELLTGRTTTETLDLGRLEVAVVKLK